MTHSKIWIGNLHYSLNEKELASLLNIDSDLIAIRRDERNRSLGHGYLIAETEIDTQRFLGSNISIIGKKIKFEPFLEKEEAINA